MTGRRAVHWWPRLHAGEPEIRTMAGRDGGRRAVGRAKMESEGHMDGMARNTSRRLSSNMLFTVPSIATRNAGQGVTEE